MGQAAVIHLMLRNSMNPLNDKMERTKVELNVEIEKGLFTNKVKVPLIMENALKV